MIIYILYIAILHLLSTVILIYYYCIEYVVSLLPEKEGRGFGTVQAASSPHSEIRGGVVMYIIMVNIIIYSS